jgi:prepilin-type N-terminal cleavage/methylation domain-containing protein
MKRHHGQSAFTLIEVLLSLAILGILLAALGTAFNASAMNYRENRNLSEAMNTARMATDKMVTLIRTGQPDPTDTAANTCRLVTADGTDMTFSYNSTQKKLYCVIGGANHVLCDNVTAMTFSKTLSGDADCVTRVLMSMTVQVGDVSKTVTSAVLVRKNL